jgi:glycosyltransferase involved in cell wall biosynthesis
MRIGMVTTFYPPYSFGGDATYVRGLARGLVARGHEVEVIHCLDAYQLLHKGPPPPEPSADDGVVVHRLHSPFGPASPILTQQTGHPVLKAAPLKRLLDHGRYDVVNFHIISLVGGPAVLGYSVAPVTLYTLHEHWLICPTHILWKNRSHACDVRTCLSCSVRSGVPPQLWRYTGLIERSLEHVDLLISPSAYTAERHRAAGVTRPIAVLPLFSVFSPAPGTELPPARPQFLCVGRVMRPKGVEPLLKTFTGLPEADLTVIGDGEERAALEARYAAWPNIRFLGRLPQAELARHYASATALVFPSVTPETFGLSIVEAAACGTPAIVNADAGGAPEIVTTTGGGLLYRGGEELAAAIRRLAQDSALASRLGALARQGYERHYTLDVHLDGYLALIAGIGSQKGAVKDLSPCAV